MPGHPRRNLGVGEICLQVWHGRAPPPALGCHRAEHAAVRQPGLETRAHALQISGEQSHGQLPGAVAVVAGVGADRITAAILASRQAAWRVSATERDLASWHCGRRSADRPG
jgi:hypothetical protein